MKPIQLVDLISQYEKIQNEIDSAVINTIRSSAYINGPQVKEFQSALEEYLSIKHVIPCANGTDALQIALMAFDLKPGDEVITPSFTYVATAEVIALLRLKPVFVDVNPDTFTINPDEIEKAISPKTKAIIPVHLYGQCADMESVMQIAEKNNLFVIEDTAQALGAEYVFRSGKKVKAGTLGHIGCTSFFPSKNLGCYGDGGALMTNDENLAKKIKMIANHGQEKKYYHEIIGVNSRLDSVQAAILTVKLKYLDEYVTARQKAAEHYNSVFEKMPETTIPATVSYSTHTYHQYTLKLSGEINRDKLLAELQKKGIPANVYYPLPVHQQNAYKNYETRCCDLSVTEELNKVVISLPIHTEMDEEQLNFICTSVLQFIKQEETIKANI